MKRKNKEHRLRKDLPKHEQFLIDNLRREWDEAEKALYKEELKKKVKETALMAAKSLLVLLAIGGVITIAAVAPNVFAAFGGRKKFRRRFFDADEFRRARRILQKRGLVERDKEDNNLKLTDRGKEMVFQVAYDRLQIRKMDEWDRKWRVVFFDVPVKHKWARDGLRSKLKLMGFFPLQKSVFVFPYPCDDEIAFLSGLYNIQRHVRLLETGSVGEDEPLKKHFGLSKDQ